MGLIKESGNRQGCRPRGEYIMLILIQKNGENIHNVLITVNLLTPRKNNYSMGFYLSNQKGEVRFYREDMLNQINSDMASYPMDYDSALDEIMDIEVIIEGKEAIETRLDRLIKYYPIIAENLREKAKCSMNINWKVNFRIVKKIQDKVIIDLGGHVTDIVKAM
ncbi:MAG: hypothetical protein H6578_02475 [Chitinophagales bacterium]|nr:hypothetical protein [Chitinophagales bacterium]